MQLLKGSQVVEPLNLVVAEPQLLKGGGHIFEILNSLDVVARKGKNFEILKALHWHNLDDRVRGERQLLTVLELVDFVIQLLDRIGKLAHEEDLSGLLGRDTALGLPTADCFSK